MPILREILGKAMLWAFLACSLTAQNYVVGWGPFGFDTRSASAGFVQVRAHGMVAMQRRNDGAVFVSGGQAEPPPPLPAGITFVDCDVGDNANCYALRSDGQIAQWGKLPPFYSANKIPVPALAPGTTYVQVAASRSDALALRSDGTLVVWGQNSTSYFSPPTPPAGTSFARVAASAALMLALTLDGRVVA
ncbi:MAG: hypothetical protein IT456_01475 [Planctomycetes bacterium]|nr:hypothetical protein [Planctomycetota bacterium]